MNISDMHVWFRQYAQQMGMQNTRAILPEQIDVVINTAISDVVNQLVRENVGLRNDRVITDNAKIGQINALRSLYKVETKPIVGGTNPQDNEVSLVGAKKHIGLYSCKNFITDLDSTDYLLHNVLYLVDLAIDYKYGGSTITRIFPVRIVEDAYLADTLNDFVLKPRVRTPVAVVHNGGLELYLGDEFEKANGQLSDEALRPNELRISYIATPAKVKYVSDVGGDNVDCDLPESMHIDILKHAVDLYSTSINGGLYNAQQNAQAQQREISRNEARPNDGSYQS